MGKDRTHRVPCRNHHRHVRRTCMETLMTELEIVLSIAVVVLLWAYRGAVRRGDHYKALMLAIGVGAINIEVDAETHTYRLEVCDEIKRHLETKG